MMITDQNFFWAQRHQNWDIRRMDESYDQRLSLFLIDFYQNSIISGIKIVFQYLNKISGVANWP
jgi:hypothetical protein